MTRYGILFMAMALTACLARPVLAAEAAGAHGFDFTSIEGVPLPMRASLGEQCSW